MTIIRRNYEKPFIPDWLEDFFSNDVNPLTKAKTATVPMANVYENDVEFRIELAVPGLKKEDVKIKLENEILSVSSNLEDNTEPETERCTKKEYSYSSFVRSFTLPENADLEKISATHRNGILYVTILKKDDNDNKNLREITIE